MPATSKSTAPGCSNSIPQRLKFYVNNSQKKSIYNTENLLKQAGITEILGFNVPQFIRADDNLRVIEMSIVKRPFVLDFAGAYLNAPPDFPDEIWTEWESGKREQFDVRWPKVQAVLAALEELNIHMVDVSPGNIAFLA
jgi:hypothetical protein